VAVGEAAYIPLRHEGMDVPEQLDLDMVLARLKPWLEDAGKKKLGQHVKYDQHVFANHGITVRGYAHDTMLQSYVLEADRPHNLTSLALRHVGRSGISYEDLCGKGKSQIPFAQVSVDKAAAYSCEDSDQTLDVHNTCGRASGPRRAAAYLRAGNADQRSAVSHRAQWREHRRGRAGTPEQRSGRAHPQARGRGLRDCRPALQSVLAQAAGRDLLRQAGLPVVKKTATGARSTDEEVLEKLAEDYPLPAKLLSTAACPSSRAPTPTSWRRWPCPATAACTPTTPRPWR
jgi:DNA polymerase-1